VSTKPITDTIRMLRGGAFMDECTTKFADVVKSVDETGKSGRLTITIDLKKQNGALAVLAKVTDKTPEPAPDADLFWPTVEGNLSIENPNQRQLTFGSVDRETGSIREVSVRAAGD
jgi:hypothetical protein